MTDTNLKLIGASFLTVGALLCLGVVQHQKQDEKSVVGHWVNQGSDSSDLEILADGTFRYGKVSGSWHLGSDSIVLEASRTSESMRLAVDRERGWLGDHDSDIFDFHRESM